MVAVGPHCSKLSRQLVGGRELRARPNRPASHSCSRAFDVSGAVIITCRFLGFVDTLGTDHVVVRSQALAMNPHASFSLGDVVQITTRLGRVGTTSFETWIEVREVDRATLEPGRVAMLGICVLVAVKNGRASQLSPKARALSNPTPFPMQVAVALSRTLRKSVEPLVGAGGACLRVPVAPRYSDEDTNLHVNQAHYLRFVEDAFTTLRESAPLAGAAGEVQRRAHEPMNAVIIEYAREASVAAGPFELLLEPAAEPPATVDAYLVKDTTVYCRVRYFTALPDLLAPVPLPKL